jgi:ferredoxin
MKEARFDLVIDPTACDGHGICAELLPECIRLDPWGFPVIDSEGIPMHLVDHAQRAAASCPRLALTLVKRGRASSGGPGPTG